MLLFSTILDINDTLTQDAFIGLVIEWNQESLHSSNVIPGIDWHGERNVRFGNERLWLEIKEYRNENIIAVRYEKRQDDGIVWDTDYVMNFNSMKMSIRLDRSFTEDALAIDQGFSTPHFITLLIEHEYLADDGELPVLRTTTEIDATNIQLLTDVINGKTQYRLPVVYVSKTYTNENPVDVDLLASKLKGVAHVLVQQSDWLNQKIRTQCRDRNEYFGAIGIYYSTGAVGHRRYLYRNDVGFDDFLLAKVVRTVIQQGNAQMVDTLFTWQGVNNALLRDRLASQLEGRQLAEAARKAAEASWKAEEAARKAAESRAEDLIEEFNEEEQRIRQEALDDAKLEADMLLEQFDAETQDLRDRIEALTRRNEALEAENQGLKAKLDTVDAQPILYAGDERDFYPGEIKDHVLSTLVQALKGMLDGSRQADVVRDVIESNDYRGLAEAKADEVKRALKNYHEMDARTRSVLSELGFEITEDGKHYKLIYHGDGRYQVALPKTPSDWRSGKNGAQEIVGKVF